MAQSSSIEWTESTWNPVAGCTPVSPGCLNCYAARMALRLEHMPNGTGRKYRGTAKRARDGRPVFSGRITLDEASLDIPRRWRLPRIIFVNSMSDLFHEDVPRDFIERVFRVMVECPQHTFQVLTKRPERTLELASALPWPANVWMGTSVETSAYYERIRLLQRVPASVRFLSCEPLLGPLRRLPLKGIHWVIVGGESGPGARPMRAEWVHEIKDQCLARDVPFFFKQWGGVNKKAAGRELEGRTWDRKPVVREGVRCRGASRSVI
ncbi:MAG: phage Gp37/Gp68 family protein [Phycisphaeraceae bacterium]|nr:MAG: phage Gp37/Gp68 family protein [Phycisphaeraceae bacterium]